MKVSEEELQALRFYEGDVGSLEDPFLKDPKAYVTWNALFFDNMTSEAARSAEGRFLNPELLKQPQRMINLSLELLKSFRHMPKREKEFVTCRVERLADYQSFLEQGRMRSFISTSHAGFLNAYADKEDLVLMKVHITPDIPCGDFGILLDEYRKEEESEVLLAPYLSFVSIPAVPSESELSIRDRNGNPPAVICDIYPKAEFPKSAQEISLPDEKQIRAGVRVYEAFNAHEKPKEEDIELYLDYKKAFQNLFLKEAERIRL